MDSPPLPAHDLVEGAAAVVATFSQFNLYDADLRALRFTTDAERGAALDIEFELPGEFATGIAAAARAAAYRITLRCADVADLSALGFGPQNVVGDYRIELLAPPPPDERTVRVWVEGAAGGALDLRCRGVRVVGVAPTPAAPAG